MDERYAKGVCCLENSPNTHNAAQRFLAASGGAFGWVPYRKLRIFIQAAG